MALTSQDMDKAAKLKALRQKINNTIEEKDKRLEDFFEEKNVDIEYDIKHKDTRFNVLPDHFLWCMDALEFTMNSPAELALQSLMAVTNFATSALYDIDPIIFGATKKVTTNEFFMDLTESGGGKTTIYDQLCAGITKFEDEERTRWAQEMEEYDILHKRWQTKKDKITRNTKDDFDITQALIDLGSEPQEPTGWQYTLPTGTRNYLIGILDKVPFARIASDEGAEFFNGHAMGGGDKESKAREMITSLSKLWSGGMINRGTGKKDDVAWIENRRLTMFFMLQPEMANFLTSPIYDSQGFIHRILITHCPEFEMPDIEYDRLPAVKEKYKQMQPFHDRIYELLKTPKKFKLVNYERMEYSTTELDLPYFDIDKDAFKLASEYCNGVKRLSREGQPYYEWKKFTKRAFEHVIRLAANLACYEGKKSVDYKSMAAGIVLFDFYLEQRLTLELGADSRFEDQLKKAERILKWMKGRTEMKQGVSKSWLTQYGPYWWRKNTEKSERARIIEELQDRGDLVMTTTEDGKAAIMLFQGESRR
jgi:hypothetical protein